MEMGLRFVYQQKEFIIKFPDKLSDNQHQGAMTRAKFLEKGNCLRFYLTRRKIKKTLPIQLTKHQILF